MANAAKTSILKLANQSKAGSLAVCWLLVNLGLFTPAEEGVDFWGVPKTHGVNMPMHQIVQDRKQKHTTIGTGDEIISGKSDDVLGLVPNDLLRVCWATARAVGKISVPTRPNG